MEEGAVVLGGFFVFKVTVNPLMSMEAVVSVSSRQSVREVHFLSLGKRCGLSFYFAPVAPEDRLGLRAVVFAVKCVVWVRIMVGNKGRHNLIKVTCVGCVHCVQD